MYSDFLPGFNLSETKTMKRSKQLHPLSMEHHLSLSLANKAIKTARSGDSEAIAELSQEIAADFPKRWNPHFSNEEATVFTFLEKYEEAPRELIRQLQTQHDEMREMAIELSKGNTSLLEDFGVLLRDHTRLEERELFPAAETLLTDDELDAVLERTESN